MLSDDDRKAIQEITGLFILAANERAQSGSGGAAEHWEQLAQQRIDALTANGRREEDVTDYIRLSLDGMMYWGNRDQTLPKSDFEALSRRIEQLEINAGLGSRHAKVERIGVVLVHGVGQQTRFEHLDSEVRKLVEALRGMPVFKDGSIVVEIAPGKESAFHADQDVWAAGAGSTVRVVAAAPGLAEKHFHFHEVWWADVNETYSIAKQIRFWLWGLSVWNYPAKERSSNAGADVVYPPDPVGGSLAFLWVRLRLLGVAAVFSLLGFSVSILLYLAKRAFDVETPKWLQVITNYVSGVKLYNQKRRLGPGFISDPDEFLDGAEEAPRYSIRRRMVRAIADAACADYDRWYVLAHSLGSVVAFNGLMDTAVSWPGYLDEERWLRLKAQRPAMAGPVSLGAPVPPHDTVPRRPSWAGDDIAYRTRIFSRFRGLLTYGSPLEKFATIWPARVPIAREPAFRPNTVWVNVFDPIDPVSGVLKSFDALSERCCPHPKNIGYAASPVLLLSHIRYMTAKAGLPDLPTATMRWLLGIRDAPGLPGNQMNALQYPPGTPTAHYRSLLAWLYWICGFILLAAIGALVMPTFLKLLLDGASVLLCEMHSLFGIEINFGIFSDSVCSAGKVGR